MPIRPNTLNRYNDILVDVLSYIQDNYSTQDLTLDWYVMHGKYPRRTIQRAFKYFAMSWEESLLEIRVEKAKDKLVRTDMTVKVIAKMVGYEHPSQFTKAFMRVTKVTPTTWRGQNQLQITMYEGMNGD